MPVLSLTISEDECQLVVNKALQIFGSRRQEKELLEWWQDLKFGLMMHWGTYSQWGIVESWSICPEDEGWCQRRGPYGSNYFAYVTAYEDLRKTQRPCLRHPAP